jgi:transposase
MVRRGILAEQFLADLRRIDVQRRDVKKKLAVAVQASGTTVTEIFGVGPAVAAAVLGDVGDIARFPSSDHFAAYNGTAPVEVSSGGRVVYRLSLRGNRRVNHAVHMAAVTQIRYQHSKGRAYYDKKTAEGKTPKEALRALKRQVSDALYKQMKADARRAASEAGPGGHPGNGPVASVAGLHPADRLFGQATPGPATTTLRPQPGPSKAPAPPAPARLGGPCPPARPRNPHLPHTGARLRAARPGASACQLVRRSRDLRRRSRLLLPPSARRKFPVPLDAENKEESLCALSDAYS